MLVETIRGISMLRPCPSGRTECPLRLVTWHEDVQSWFGQLALVTVGASDELAAGSFASRSLPHLAFRLDESHSAMKKVLKADPEVQKTEELLVCGQESVSKFRKTSGTAKSLLQAAEMEDAVGVLFLSSWAMQRFDSKKKPLARVCQGLGHWTFVQRVRLNHLDTNLRSESQEAVLLHKAFKIRT